MIEEGCCLLVPLVATVVKTECLHGVSSRGGPRSETGSQSQRESECMRGSGRKGVEGAV